MFLIFLFHLGNPYIKKSCLSRTAVGGSKDSTPTATDAVTTSKIHYRRHPECVSGYQGVYR
jgi:hypothetical protein